MRHENAHTGAFGLGRAQTPAQPRVEDDVETIRELLERIRQLWGDLTVDAREELGERMRVLGAAVESCDTSSRPVREMLQHVLLTVGTGALATLSEPTRRRLAALTGIGLPGRRAPTDRGSPGSEGASPSFPLP